jgi:hypothetical protein
MIRGFNVDVRGIDRGDPMTSNRRTPHLLRGMLLFILLLSGLQCASISPYSPTAYQYATSLKVESLMLMAKAIEPYPSHQAEVEALVTKIDIAYEYAKGRPKNTISTQQWEILKDPNRHLLGGFLQRWKDASQLSQPFVTEAQGLVAGAFDAIIGLESGKVASTQGQ